MKVALLQLNPTVGDVEGNSSRIADAAGRALTHGADLAVSPELALSGYPPRDLLLWPRFVERVEEAVADLARRTAGGPALLVGGPEANPGREGRRAFNTAYLLQGGQVTRRFRKCLLPTYDVFDEDRYFEPAPAPEAWDIGGARIGVTICEDIWNDRAFWQVARYRLDPVEDLARRGAKVLLNLSASPYTAEKQRTREAMLGALARRHALPALYVNQVGGNDDLLFDGSSFAVDARGEVVARAAAFEEDLLVVEVPSAGAPSGRVVPSHASVEEELWKALVLGTRDYARKCGFRGALVGLSGGIDSALTATIAAEALGPENVLGVLMPSPFSSRGSVDDARELARNLGVRTIAIPIRDLMAGFDAALREGFAGKAPDTTEENVQSRIRGNLLMALSNKHGLLLLTTGNKSELAVGYCTIYGDMSGGLAVISDLPKTMVYRVSRWRNAQGAVIPEASLTKAPSAELRPDQTDQDSLPPYEVLDAILARYIEQHRSPEEIVKDGFDEPTVRRVVHLVKVAEFKRRQAPPGLKVTDLAFGTGWRVPIARAAWDLPPRGV